MRNQSPLLSSDRPVSYVSPAILNIDLLHLCASTKKAVTMKLLRPFLQEVMCQKYQKIISDQI